MDAFDLILKECRERIHRKRILLIPDRSEVPMLQGKIKEEDDDTIQDKSRSGDTYGPDCERGF